MFKKITSGISAGHKRLYYSHHTKQAQKNLDNLAKARKEGSYKDIFMSTLWHDARQGAKVANVFPGSLFRFMLGEGVRSCNVVLDHMQNRDDFGICAWSSRPAGIVNYFLIPIFDMIASIPSAFGFENKYVSFYQDCVMGLYAFINSTAGFVSLVLEGFFAW